MIEISLNEATLLVSALYKEAEHLKIRSDAEPFMHLDPLSKRHEYSDASHALRQRARELGVQITEMQWHLGSER